jgi:hypothetical protein
MDSVALLSVLELVAINICAECTSDIGRSHLGTLGLAEERAELILEGNRGGEDGGTLLLGDTILALTLGATTATTGQALRSS